jgi:hypothetical protein
MGKRFVRRGDEYFILAGDKIVGLLSRALKCRRVFGRRNGGWHGAMRDMKPIFGF